MAADLDILLADWTGRRGIDTPERDERGRRFLVFDGAHEVVLTERGDRIRMEAAVATLPPQPDAAEALLDSLLRLQTARSGAASESLAMDPETDALVVIRTLDSTRLDLRGFDRALGAFVNAAAFFQAKADPSDRGAAAPGPAFTQFLFP